MIKETSEYQKFIHRKRKEYSIGHQRCYLGPINLISQGERPLRILDVGSGIGWGCQKMCELIPSLAFYYGVEQDEDSVKFHKEQLASIPNINVECNDWLKSDFSETVDYSFCIEVIEHLPLDLVLPFVKKIAKVTNKGLFLSTPEKTKNPHGTLYRGEVFKILRNVGFQNALVIDEHWTTLYIAQ